MPDISTAFRDAQLVAELKERQRTPESRERAKARRERYNAPRGLTPGGGTIASIDEEQSVPCFDPWMIVKTEPNREVAAHTALRREGFECWYPAGRLLKAMPRDRISSKNRHKKQHVVLEDLRLPYPGYLFIRRLTPHSQGVVIWRLYELEGVTGLCMFGETVAIAEHYEIEMLRFKEDVGAFDVWELDITAKQFALADIRRSEAAKDRWEKPPAVLGTLDTTQRKGLVLVEAFGRITRVVAATGDQHIAR